MFSNNTTVNGERASAGYTVFSGDQLKVAAGGSIVAFGAAAG